MKFLLDEEAVIACDCNAIARQFRKKFLLNNSYFPGCRRQAMARQGVLQNIKNIRNTEENHA